MQKCIMNLRFETFGFGDEKLIEDSALLRLQCFEILISWDDKSICGPCFHDFDKAASKLPASSCSVTTRQFRCVTLYKIHSRDGQNKF
jgi:hypothetical protein